MLEAMSAGCLLIASATASVQEVITDGKNGLLFPFHEPTALANRAIEALSEPDRYLAIREAARQTIISSYDFETICYPAFIQLINQNNP